MSNFWIINYYIRNLYNESSSSRSNTPLQYYETMLVGATDKLCLPATRTQQRSCNMNAHALQPKNENIKLTAQTLTKVKKAKWQLI